MTRTTQRLGDISVAIDETGHVENGQIAGLAVNLATLLQLKINNQEVTPSMCGAIAGDVSEDSLQLTQSLPGFQVVSQSLFKHDPTTGIIRRQDRLTNTGSAPVTLQQCLSQFVFSIKRTEVYYQRSAWSAENQGAWQQITDTPLHLRCKDSRTTLDFTPFVAIRSPENGNACAFHILPQGNWTIDICHAPNASQLTLNLGLADDRLNLTLDPGSTLELPDILIQPLSGGEIHQATAKLHHYLLASTPENQQKTDVPVVYNCWFDRFDAIDPDRLKQQLDAAKALGCEVFVVDAGWYGGEDRSWGTQTGDWRENKQKAFKGEMARFADLVRQQGLEFGLWMEPERLNPEVPVVVQHPDWFLEGENHQFYPDLSKEAVCNYIHEQIGQLIARYQLAWIKVDYNFSFGPDPHQQEFRGYYRSWYEIINQLKREYPKTFFEGCASGGLRSDLTTLSHFDNHFLSDNVNPFDVLRISQGALLRLPPGKLGKWLVIRSIRSAVPLYGSTIDTDHPFTIVPAGSGATWNEFHSINLDFACCTALTGNLGLSGDIASLTPEQRKKVRDYIDFYKHWRRFISGSVAHLLTPVKPMSDRDDWIAFQLSHPERPESLLFVFRLNHPDSGKAICLSGLQTDQTYRVEARSHDFSICADGQALMTKGLEIHFKQKNQADIFIITQA